MENTWLEIADLADGKAEGFDIEAHREELFELHLGKELWKWLGERCGEKTC